MELYLATQNEHKVIEIQKVMPAHITIRSLKDLGCTEEIPETQDSLEGNAIQKAEYIAHKYNVNCFSDDTGLEVSALNNEPGVYSARYAGPEKNAEKNMDLLLEKLGDSTDRRAQFRTVVALVLAEKTHTFEGKVIGEIRSTKAGNGGFGYDPIFEPEQKGKTFAEMTLDEKNQCSHRARAVEKLVAFLKKEGA